MPDVDGSTRRTRFETRIALERDFLTRVNAKFGLSTPLAGMTRDAIESWAARAGAITEPSLVSDVARLLIEVSARADLMADNSKDVFEPDQRRQPDSLCEIRDLLDKTLTRARI
jgi:hypothetical protein